MTPRGFSTPIACAVGLGLLAGMACHAAGPLGGLAADAMAAVAGLFLRLVGLLAAPMLLASIVAGLGGVDAGATLRRVGWRTAAWFAAGSALALAAGLAATAALPMAPMAGLLGASAGPMPPPDFAALARRLAPDSLPGALLHGEALQVAVFAAVFGAALSSVKGVLSNTLLDVAEDGVIVMLGLAQSVTRLSPVAAFAAAASVTARHGLPVVVAYGGLVCGTVCALALAALLLAAAAAAMLGRDTPRLLLALRDPVALGFATSSSEAACARLSERLEEAGAPHRVGGMVLPLGIAFNQCGSIAALAFAVPFLAHAYGMELGRTGLMWALLLVSVLARGMVGVPHAALLALGAIGSILGLPAEAALLLLGVDPLLDRARTAVNVLGNGLAVMVVARWATLPRTGRAPAPKPSNEPAGAACSRVR